MDPSPEDVIVSAVLAAISEQRLPPGTKLGEQELSDLFQCNRANVRRALTSLAAQHAVELLPNRGAFVVVPSVEEAHDIFQARRSVERTIARWALARVTAKDITYLQSNISAEIEAREREDKPAELRLSQQFHMYLAKLAGNRVLERFLAELTVRSTLILGMYSPDGHSCRCKNDHRKILNALSDRDEELLLQLTDNHLRSIEVELNFYQPLFPRLSLKDQLFP